MLKKISFLCFFLLIFSTYSCSSKPSIPTTQTNRSMLNQQNIQDTYIGNHKDIIVIYKEEFKIRVDKKNNKLIDNGKYDYNKLISILTRYKIKKISDLIPNFMEDQLKSKGQSIEQIATFASIHNYYFPEFVDSDKLIEKLKRLEFVKNAYVSLPVMPSDLPPKKRT